MVLVPLEMNFYKSTKMGNLSNLQEDFCIPVVDERTMKTLRRSLLPKLRTMYISLMLKKILPLGNGSPFSFSVPVFAISSASQS